MQSKYSFYDVLLPYQKEIEDKIIQTIPRLGRDSELRAACVYALMNGGKRFRPTLVSIIAKGLGKGLDVSEASLAIEYFHTASLIADDLPCMDDDDERRQRPALHIKFDEATALLVSYALISEGYECLARNAFIFKQSESTYSAQSEFVFIEVIKNVSFNTGLNGATGGQYLDIYPPDLNEKTVREIIHKKTVSLFEVSFVLGWLFGGGDPQKINLVKRAASYFGMAFQIADDIGDQKQDIQNERLVNVANIFGVEGASQMLQRELKGFIDTLEKLSLNVPEFQSLGNLLLNSVVIKNNIG